MPMTCQQLPNPKTMTRDDFKFTRRWLPQLEWSTWTLHWVSAGDWRPHVTHVNDWRINEFNRFNKGRRGWWYSHPGMSTIPIIMYTTVVFISIRIRQTNARQSSNVRIPVFLQSRPAKLQWKQKKGALEVIHENIEVTMCQAFYENCHFYDMSSFR